MEAKLETNKAGSKVLICTYQGNGFDEAIEQAEAELNPKGEPLAVICLPVGFGNDNNRMGGRGRFFSDGDLRANR